MSLTVYRSSAGSGKTHTLVLEYLTITLQNPDKFRRVLAITFTNKAAGEMKERIISALTDFSKGNTESSLAADILKKTGFTPEKLVTNATALLANIIHRFEEFGVSTIDSFVHKIIRTFANDVRLPHGFEVVIDNDDIIPEIIEDLYNKLGEDKELTKVMVAFVLSLTEDEKSYNPEKSLIEFIQKQTREDGFEEIKKLKDLNLTRFLEILLLIDKKTKELKNLINKTSQDALQLVKNNNLDASAFAGGRYGLVTYFKKNVETIDDKSLIPTPTVLKTFTEKWYSNKAKESDKNAINAIKEPLTAYFDTVLKKGQKYILLKTVYSKLYAVALIKEIKTLFDDFTLRTNKVHISEFNKRISDTIAGQPTPFIYERLGNRYDHFLIDEFQDTSVLQWYNLLPLIENSLANGQFNMLVGDAKQAIYRFRSGEVELFSSLPKLYGKPNLQDRKLREQQIEEAINEKYLDYNYRSYKNIVEFNNDFFPKIIDPKYELITKIYQNHKQKISGKKNHDGYVSISLIDAEDASDYREKRLDKILEHINNLKQKGFAYGDICILSLRREDGTEDAAHLLNNNIPVISSESLLLTGSAYIRAIISIFSALLQPENRVVLGEIIENILIIKKQPHKLTQLSTTLLGDTKTAFAKIMAWAGIKTPIKQLKQKPVYLLAENIFNDISNQTKPNIYFQYFLDFIAETETIYKNRLDAFLELWEQKKEKLFILLPEGEDAVQIMTIHKAKGLKFQAVILDFQSRKTQNTKDEFWIDNPLPEIPDLTAALLPVNKDKLKAIGYSNYYDYEKEKTRLDFINLIYVAFTRPVEALFILAETKGTSERFSKEIIKYLEVSELYKPDKMLYEFGELKKLEKTEASSNKHTLLSKWVSNGGDFPVQIAPPEDIYWEMAGGNSQRTKGKLIHEILSHIKTARDIEKSLNQYLTAGIIDILEKQELKQEIDLIVKHPKLTPYFSGSGLIKNETEIILKNNEIVRPDRVVINNNEVTIIDYKTGEKEDEHLKQIKKYKQAFLELGFDNIKGMLVYLREKIEIVT